MKAFIKNIKINNFKGIASYYIDFNEDVNEIIAVNGSGKSSIKYAWQWVLCQNVPDVLPTLNNKEIPNLVTSVELLININNIDYTFKRESKGNYKTNEQNISCKISNTNSYFIDGIQIKTETDYKNKIANLLGDRTFENLVLLTDKEAFNSDSPKWKWDNRRNLLFKICNIDSVVKNIIESQKYDDIRPYVLKNYSTNEIKSMFAKEKKTLKDQQSKNAILVEQKIKENEEFSKLNFDELEKELNTLNNKLNKLQNSSKKELQSEKLQELQEQLLQQSQELTKLQNADIISLNNLHRFANEVYKDAQNLYYKYNNTKIDCETLQLEIDKIKDTNIETVCPTCHQNIPENVIQTTKDNLAKQLATLQNDLEAQTKDLEEIKAQYKEKQAQYNSKKAEIDNFVENQKIKELENAISLTKTALEQAKPSKLNNLSSEEKKSLEDHIKSINADLVKKQFIETNKTQIRTWQANSRECADKIIVIEKKEKQLQDFIKEQTDIIYNTINEKFGNGVSWSLYNETYKDGNGGIVEDCVCMYNGKRYTSMSTGEKNVANLEVMKVLQDYFDVKLPVFSENDESITTDYKVENRQLIKLIAQKNAKLENLVKIEDLYKENN